MKNLENNLENPCIKCNSVRRLLCFTGCKPYNHYLYINDRESREFEELDYIPQWESNPGEAALNNYDEDYK